MVAVMIVSVVIAALFKLRGDTNHLFSKIQESQKNSCYATFLLWNQKYGLDKAKTKVDLYRLVEEFDMDDALRRELKAHKAEINYNRVDTIETDDLTIEIGKTSLRSKDFDFNFNRIILR